MKQLTCKQIGGVCDAVLVAETMDGMAKAATEHIMTLAKTDPVHAQSAKEMEAIYNDKDRHAVWEKDFQKEWDKAPAV